MAACDNTGCHFFTPQPGGDVEKKAGKETLIKSAAYYRLFTRYRNIYIPVRKFCISHFPVIGCARRWVVFNTIGCNICLTAQVPGTAFSVCVRQRLGGGV